VGCHNFALFFDDIEEKMTDADKALFNDSFAGAQASVTNTIFTWLQSQGMKAESVFLLLF